MKPTKTPSKRATSHPTETKSLTSTKEAPANVPPVGVGQPVHYHPESPREHTPASAWAATVLHVADATRGRVDLLVHDKDGKAATVRDVEYSAKRTSRAWSSPTAE